MNIFAKTLRRLANRMDPPRAMAKRAYSGAAFTNALANWRASQTTGDAELRTSYRVLLNRCRELERNNPHMAAFLRAVEMNAAGPNGFTFQSNITELRKVDGVFRLMPDELANSRVEDAYYRWSKPRFCSLNQQLSYPAFQRLLARTVARDGTALIRKVRGAAARNEFNFALQMLEVDHLDLDLFAARANGNAVKFGIEFDPDGRPVSYTIFPVHPGDTSVASGSQRARVVIPASDMILAMLPRRISQVIGDPWIVSAMSAMQMVGKLEEYELIAGMVCASKMGFFVNTGEGVDTGALGTEGDTGTTIDEAVPGAFNTLPRGYDLKTFDPSHPNPDVTGFTKLILREVAVGCGVAASTLTGDLSDTNYSSMRAGLGEERENWKMVQNWLTDTVLEPIFPEWLEMAMLSGKLNLPFAKFEKFNQPKYHGRRWTSVNPLEDANALKILLTMGVTSRTQYLNQNGGDFGETIAELGIEMAQAKELDVPIVDKDPYQNQDVAAADKPLDNANQNTKGANS